MKQSTSHLLDLFEKHLMAGESAENKVAIGFGVSLLRTTIEATGDVASDIKRIATALEKLADIEFERFDRERRS